MSETAEATRHPRYLRPEGEAYPPVEPADLEPAEIKDLLAAMAEAQKKIQNAEVDQDNEFLKSRYASLASVMSVVRTPLAEQGLSIIQYAVKSGEPGWLTVETMLGHSSGQYITSRMSMKPEKDTPQALGSCLTYIRRYSISALCGVAQYDDDAEATKKGSQEYERISAAETDEILQLADKLFADRSEETLVLMLGKVFSTSENIIDKVSDIPAGQAKQAIQLLENRAARELQPPADDEKPEADGKKPPKGRTPGEDDE